MIRLFAKSVPPTYMYVYVCKYVCVCVRIHAIDSRSIRIRWNSRNRRSMDETESIDPTSPRTFKDNGNRIDIENLKITRK